MKTLAAYLAACGFLFLNCAHGAPYVDPALAALVQKRGEVRVIVNVKRSPSTLESSAGTLMRVANVDAARVTQIHPGAVALKIDQSALNTLRSDEQITGIYVDRPAFPSLHETAAITAAVPQWKQGHMGRNVTIAVLDTGIDQDHPFVKSKIVMQACFSVHDPAKHIEHLCPPGGFVAGGNAVATSPGSAAGCAGKTPDCDHGTHVAGIAAGAELADPERTALRIAGIAKGATLFPIQVFSKIDDADECNPNPPPCYGAYTSAQIRALEYVRNKVRASKSDKKLPNIVAVNMSLGSGSYPAECDNESPLTQTIKELRGLGVVTFIAAGNDGSIDGIAMPACISHAVAIGALDKPGAPDAPLQYASYSNRAEDRLISLLAVGTDVRSSVPGNQYRALQGTSMATPVAAGAYAILRSEYPNKSVDEILDAMKATGSPVADPVSGKARPAVNVDGAYRKLAGLPAAAPGAATTGTTFATAPSPSKGTRFIVEVPRNKGAEGTAAVQSFSSSIATELNVGWVNASRLTTEKISVTVPSPVTREEMSEQLTKAIKHPIKVFVDRADKPLTANKQSQ
jgi:subtilisin family serine protease